MIKIEVDAMWRIYLIIFFIQLFLIEKGERE